VLDELRRATGLADWRGRFSGSWTKGDAFGGEVILLKPETFMNRSGDCVQATVAFFKLDPSRLLVVHDELDIPFGDVRLKVGGGHAGHNGVRSVIDRLGTADFVRLRVGIGRPPAGAAMTGIEVSGHVLGDFAPDERSRIPAIVGRAVDAVERVLRDGVASAMNAVNAAVGKSP
jgi:peptidyl-tRNA hydrolase, PTH1 family